MADSENTPAETPEPPPPQLQEKKGEQQVEQEPKQEASSGAPAKPRQPSHWLATGLGLLALVVSLVLGWLLWQGNLRLESTREELSRRLADSDAVQREAQSSTRQGREALDALQAKVGALDARAAEMQSQQLALETMYQEMSRAREDRLLAEIEQDVAIAAQQLQLAGNVEAALIVLQAADARLAKNAQAQFLPLRKLIARDIERLKALPGADVMGIAQQLDELLNDVPNLPLAYEQRPAATVPAEPKPAKPAKPARPPATKEPAVPVGKAGTTDASSAPAAPADDSILPAVTAVWQAVGNMGQAWLGEMWQELRQLVRIERIDRPDPGLLSPRESYFLRENLRLRLLSARLGLLARDGRSFQSDLKQADAWLEQYFDTRAPIVVEARTTLTGLSKQDVMKKPPELNETLSALRNFKLSRDRGDRGAAR